MVKSPLFSMEYHWNNSGMTVLFLIPLTFSRITVALTKVIGMPMENTVIPETFSMGYCFGASSTLVHPCPTGCGTLSAQVCKQTHFNIYAGKYMNECYCKGTHFYK